MANAALKPSPPSSRVSTPTILTALIDILTTSPTTQLFHIMPLPPLACGSYSSAIAALSKEGDWQKVVGLIGAIGIDGSKLGRDEEMIELNDFSWYARYARYARYVCFACIVC